MCIQEHGRVTNRIWSWDAVTKENSVYKKTPEKQLMDEYIEGTI